MLFELISPEKVLFSGEVRAVMLPATEGDMTVMPGHEATMVMLNPGVIAVTDTQGHGHRAFVRGGFVEITGTSVSALAERALPAGGAHERPSRRGDRAPEDHAGRHTGRPGPPGGGFRHQPPGAGEDNPFILTSNIFKEDDP
jgi:ATP synthase F1 epsilon subunit